jgi:hypothetical protein
VNNFSFPIAFSSGSDESVYFLFCFHLGWCLCTSAGTSMTVGFSATTICCFCIKGKLSKWYFITDVALIFFNLAFYEFIRALSERSSNTSTNRPLQISQSASLSANSSISASSDDILRFNSCNCCFRRLMFAAVSLLPLLLQGIQQLNHCFIPIVKQVSLSQRFQTGCQVSG